MGYAINLESTKRGNASEAKPNGGESSKPTPRSYPAERHGGQPPGAGAGSQNTRRKLERGSRGRELVGQKGGATSPDGRAAGEEGR